MKKSALVILSGGQDSTTCLFWAKNNFEEVHAVTFDYGQRHVLEIDAARKVAELAGVASHEVIAIPGILQSTSPLTAKDEILETYSNAKVMAEVIGNRVEKTFVPMRNMFFFVVAMNRAVALGCDHLVTGICAEDNANYPDCTRHFRDMFALTANVSLGTAGEQDRIYGKGRYHLEAPLLNMDKADTVRMARGIPGCWEALAYTHTSYDGKYPPTDMNHANVLRADGFHKSGFPDPLVLRAWNEGLMPLPNTTNYDRARAMVTPEVEHHA